MSDACSKKIIKVGGKVQNVTDTVPPSVIKFKCEDCYMNAETKKIATKNLFLLSIAYILIIVVTAVINILRFDPTTPRYVLLISAPFCALLSFLGFFRFPTENKGAALITLGPAIMYPILLFAEKESFYILFAVPILFFCVLFYRTPLCRYSLILILVSVIMFLVKNLVIKSAPNAETFLCIMLLLLTCVSADIITLVLNGANPLSNMSGKRNTYSENDNTYPRDRRPSFDASGLKQAHELGKAIEFIESMEAPKNKQLVKHNRVPAKETAAVSNMQAETVQTTAASEQAVIVPDQTAIATEQTTITPDQAAITSKEPVNAVSIQDAEPVITPELQPEPEISNASQSSMAKEILFLTTKAHREILELQSAVNLQLGSIQKMSKAMEEAFSEVGSEASRAASMQELSSSAHENADRFQKITEEIIGSTSKGNDLLSELKEKTLVVVRSAKETAQAGHLATIKSEELSALTETIKELSKECNVLALSASIEASRAGEAGKGFAQVASDVRLMSERSEAFFNDLGAHLKELQENVNSTSASADNMIRTVQEQHGVIYQADENMTDINDSMEKCMMLMPAVIEDMAGISELSKNLVSLTERLSAMGDELIHTATNALGTTLNTSSGLDRIEVSQKDIQLTLDEYRD